MQSAKGEVQWNNFNGKNAEMFNKLEVLIKRVKKRKQESCMTPNY